MLLTGKSQRDECHKICGMTGHSAAVHTLEFSPDGEAVASGSADKSVFLWKVHGDCSNYAVLSGHQNTVLELHWTTDGEHVVSASADKSVRAMQMRRLLL